MNIRIGTRKSPLAQIQATWVAAQIRERFPEIGVELVGITTSGDRPSPYPLPQGEGPGGLKALFTKEIEEALLANHIDLAVHSLKDMATELPKGLVLSAVPLREDPRDVWISKTHIPFNEVKEGAKIGTGAVRRHAQLRHLRPDFQVLPLRGNVDTRLQRLREDDWDGIILALAGLKRLGRQSAVTEILSNDIMLPAVGQGALAIETRERRDDLSPILAALNHQATHQAVLCERALLRTLGGSCQTPIAAYAEVHGTTITLSALVASPAGAPYFRNEASDSAENAETLGRALAKELLIAGADKILA